MMKISAVVITYNEELEIERCLKSLQGVADEIVVVDSFSTDRTKEICLQYGVQFFAHQWEGYGNQKNWGSQQTGCPYVLSIDADEYLSPELQEAIIEIKKNGMHDAYSFNRLNVYCGKAIRYGEWRPEETLRLWNKDKGSWSTLGKQELVQMQSGATVKRLSENLIHSSYGSIAAHIEQSATYCDLWVKWGINQRKHVNILKCLAVYPWRFINSCFFKLGFLDGPYGVMISDIIAYESFSKYNKLRLYKKRLAKQREQHPVWLKPVSLKLRKLRHADSLLNQSHVIPVGKD